MAERKFQKALIDELKQLFPGCWITKLDAGYIQGSPDLLILFNNKWATLEVKDYEAAKRQPNQEYYVNMHNKMSFSRVIYPENKEEVLYELQQAFRA